MVAVAHLGTYDEEPPDRERYERARRLLDRYKAAS